MCGLDVGVCVCVPTPLVSVSPFHQLTHQSIALGGQVHYKNFKTFPSILDSVHRYIDTLAYPNKPEAATATAGTTTAAK